MDENKEPRSISNQEVSRLIEFLNTELRPQATWSIEQEYPTTFTPKNSRNLFIIEEEDQLLSHAAIRYILIKTPQAVFKVAAIGSVVTSSEHRRQGHSHKLLQLCLEKARSEKADLAILWSDLVSFYQKIGFQLSGSEMSFLFDRPLLLEAPKEPLKFIEGDKLSPEALLKCYSKHTVSSVRTLEDIKNYLKIPNSRIYSAWNSRGQLEAYAVEGKGADLSGYIHEWGGNVTSLLHLVQHIQTVSQKPITLIAPQHSQGLIRKLQKLKVPMHHGHLGLIKPLNVSEIIQKVIRHARAQGVSDLVLTPNPDGTFLFGVGQSVCQIPSEQHLTTLLFGPIPDNFWMNFSEEKQEILQRILPMHLWIWGWDSI